MAILRVTLDHLDEVAILFDEYRQFYQQPADLEGCRAFIQQRLQTGNSAIFGAQKGDQLVGFTQLYPSFSSVSMQPIWILNDLFVAIAHRRQGLAQALMETAANFARETGAIRLSLSTQIENTAAQSLYESLGYCKDEAFYHYDLAINPTGTNV
ncbi:MAG: GNAT family N-acetyltransferase [Cyanobacteria bacterium P01_D01_bin.6]